MEQTTYAFHKFISFRGLVLHRPKWVIEVSKLQNHYDININDSKIKNSKKTKWTAFTKENVIIKSFMN